MAGNTCRWWLRTHVAQWAPGRVGNPQSTCCMLSLLGCVSDVRLPEIGTVLLGRTRTSIVVAAVARICTVEDNGRARIVYHMGQYGDGGAPVPDFTVSAVRTMPGLAGTCDGAKVCMVGRLDIPPALARDVHQWNVATYPAKAPVDLLSQMLRRLPSDMTRGGQWDIPWLFHNAPAPGESGGIDEGGVSRSVWTQIAADLKHAGILVWDAKHRWWDLSAYHRWTGQHFPVADTTVPAGADAEDEDRAMSVTETMWHYDGGSAHAVPAGAAIVTMTQMHRFGVTDVCYFCTCAQAGACTHEDFVSASELRAVLGALRMAVPGIRSRVDDFLPFCSGDADHAGVDQWKRVGMLMARCWIERKQTPFTQLSPLLLWACTGGDGAAGDSKPSHSDGGRGEKSSPGLSAVRLASSASTATRAWASPNGTVAMRGSVAPCRSTGSAPELSSASAPASVKLAPTTVWWSTLAT